ncbi:MAG: Glycerophosphoryl diester phosphodiesterase [Microgenomates group bacterium GW2011_GWC1_37_8]|uniref:Glycerophosphoryl diester phosphodiesterase n=1 Tax=Candidatus Woesebacteria bacterium GW2011_GWB1_38_8 TaxID=1618570 RepID=A0A0G0L141_9BACT|nr:MAG: Glycerophosphoryl diester phosphodiesterase [Microgenomates group bacterium GW2011_GWC1_37_8]KKQ84712.1 MAG: Glycerophosphoryl diester phosphodiesterase [Candidatus Woesebacteria bacterium GW2011_GWB1_38_8]
MDDQIEQTEAKPVTEGQKISNESIPLLKALARVTLAETNTFTPKEVDYFVNSKEFSDNAKRVQIIAHKSGGGEAPEGTILAMEKALENGAGWLDIDLRMTKGESESEAGTIIISHSPRAEDVAASNEVKGAIPDLTLEQIKKLDAGHNFTTDNKTFPHRGEVLDVPTLEEALIKFPNARFTMHLLGTNEGIEGELVRIIEKYNAFDRVFVAGFSEEPLIKVKELSGGRIKRGAGAKETIEFMDAVKRGEVPETVDFDYFVPGGEGSESKILLEKYGAKLMDWARREKLPDIDYIVACKKLGIPIYVWTVNDKEEMMRWIALGVDGIYTDYPSRLNGVKTEYGSRDFIHFSRDGIYISNAYPMRVIAEVAARRLAGKKGNLTQEDIVAEIRKMEFFLNKGGEKSASIGRQMNDLVYESLEKGAPPLDPKLEEVISSAVLELK